MTDPRPSRSIPRVVLAGGSGFVGQALSERLQKAGYEVLILTRAPSSGPRSERWDGESVGDWARLLEGAAAVVNLSGAPVTLRWTESNKRLIRDSRVKSTSAIGQAIRQCRIPPKVWVNASATGIYGDSGDRECDESSQVGEGFLAETCLAWERAQSDSPIAGTRKVRVRIGIVLGRKGGAYPELAKYAAMYLGGHQGSGRHWMSWIHVDDLASVFQFAIETEVEGAVNAVSPVPVQNAEFMEALRKSLGKPWSPPAPAFAIKFVGFLKGIQADVVLQSQRVIPGVLNKLSFDYRFPELGAALADLAEEG